MNQELLNQFLSLLEASKSFKLLEPDQQTAVKAGYENATDEQLNKAIQTLDEDRMATEKLEAEVQEAEVEMGKDVTELKTTMRKVERDDRKQEEAADHAADEKEEKALLKEIETMGESKTEAPEKKKKKFLGIF